MQDPDVGFVKGADEDAVHAGWSIIAPPCGLFSSFYFPGEPVLPVAELLAFFGLVLAPDVVTAEFAALECVGLGNGVDDAGRGGCYGLAVGISARTGADDEEPELFGEVGRG